MVDSLIFLIVLIFIALFFDFLNGFHDSANSISTIVSTRVLSPKYAVFWAAFFNFAAAFLVGTPVAKTIGVGIINPGIVDDYLILSALGGAIIWNIVTWYFGLPSSSSHALIGGFAAETAAAISIITATFFGIPVSTTHTITGAIVGVGATKRWTAVR